MRLEYIAHSAFAIDVNGRTILIDPFISQNPLANYDWENRNIRDILLTHSHGDKGASVRGVNLGGKLNYEWGDAWFVPAQHSSSTPDGVYGGIAAGIILNINGTKIYHAGDTSLSAEMKLIKEVYKPEIALLPVGGFYTMGVDEAVIAAQLLGVGKVIPMHYNTFPAINVNIDSFKYKLETHGLEAIILKPGENIEL